MKKNWKTQLWFSLCFAGLLFECSIRSAWRYQCSLCITLVNGLDFNIERKIVLINTQPRQLNYLGLFLSLIIHELSDKGKNKTIMVVALGNSRKAINLIAMPYYIIFLTFSDLFIKTPIFKLLFWSSDFLLPLLWQTFFFMKSPFCIVTAYNTYSLSKINSCKYRS